MAAQENERTRLTCKRCGHTWIPRTAITRICPHCKSAYWDVERIRKVKDKDKGEVK